MIEGPSAGLGPFFRAYASYDEVIDATQGQGGFLTLTSAAEGFGTMLMGGELRSDFAEEDIEGLKKLVST